MSCDQPNQIGQYWQGCRWENCKARRLPPCPWRGNRARTQPGFGSGDLLMSLGCQGKTVHRMVNSPGLTPKATYTGETSKDRSYVTPFLPAGAVCPSADLLDTLRWVSKSRSDALIERRSVTSVLSDSATTWTVARQAPLSVGFSRQEDWTGLPCPPPGGLPHPGMEASCTSRPVLYH